VLKDLRGGVRVDLTGREKNYSQINLKKKIKISQIITTNQNNKRKQNKSQSNFIGNSLSQSTRTVGVVGFIPCS
jgi:hypothetical protein